MPTLLSTTLTGLFNNIKGVHNNFIEYDNELSALMNSEGGADIRNSSR